MILVCLLTGILLAETGEEQVVSAEEVSQNQISSVTVVIDPGHGGNPEEEEQNGGAFYQDVYEKDLNLIVANAMAEELKQYQGVEVYQTRTADQKMDLEERVEFAKQKNADVLIGIHFNASEKHVFYGSEVWTSMFGKYYAAGYGLGTCFLNQFEEMGLLNRGVKTRKEDGDEDYYGLIRHGVHMDVPAIIVEHCYLDDIQDYSYADSEAKLIEFGKNDAAAVAEYYGLNKETLPEHIEPTISVPILDTPILPDETEPESVVLTLNHYDAAKGVASVTISAEEKESRLLYYGYSLDGGTTYSRLDIWTGENGTCEAEIPVGKDFDGSIQAIVYNNFNKDAVSNPVIIVGPEEETESRGDMTYDLEDVYDLPEQNFIMTEPVNEEATTEETVSVYEVLLIVFVIIFAVLFGTLIGLILVMRVQKKRRKQKHIS